MIKKKEETFCCSGLDADRITQNPERKTSPLNLASLIRIPDPNSAMVGSPHFL